MIIGEIEKEEVWELKIWNSTREGVVREVESSKMSEIGDGSRNAPVEAIEGEIQRGQILPWREI